MPESDLTQRIDALIKRVEARNKETQEAKKNGFGGWVTAVVLALISMVGIGMAMWLASRRSKELAKAHTKLEQDEIRQFQVNHEARKVTLFRTRNTLMKELKKQDAALQERRKTLFLVKAQHQERLREIESLTAWKDLNAS